VHVLLTGASSFTGFWFAERLVSHGVAVLATLSGPDTLKSYSCIRAERVSKLKELCRTTFGIPFGSRSFFDFVRGVPRLDVFCHHWSQVRDYRSSTFDVLAAVAQNTQRFPDLLHILKDKGCGRIVITGSVGEPDEGVGSQPHSAFSAYTLSKRLSFELARFCCEREGIILDKFVIPNPFGPLEEARFTHYLMTSWLTGRVPAVTTPAYVRDNIHVDLLAKAYAQFVLDSNRRASTPARLAPSGYVETQGAFAERVAREVSRRLPIQCPLDLKSQDEFPEPPVRINTDVLSIALGWNESAAWNNFTTYYSERLGRKGRIE
jgi:UDP-glucose 4-epimerase